MVEVTFRQLIQNWRRKTNLSLILFKNHCRNGQNVVLNESFGGAPKSFGRQLAIARAEVILSEKLLLVFRCFTNKMVLFDVL